MGSNLRSRFHSGLTVEATQTASGDK